MVSAVPTSLHTIAPLVSQYGYFAVFGLLFLEDFGVPVPGETMLIAAAVFAGLGKLNIFVVALVAIAAAFAGDNLGYVIGRTGGRKLLDRYGKYVLLTEEKVAKATGYFDRYGGVVVMFARFFEGLRQLNGILAGMSGMHWRTFAAFNAAGATLWVATWASVGYFGGDHINTIERYGRYFALAGGLLLLSYMALRIIRRMHSRKQQEPV